MLFSQLSQVNVPLPVVLGDANPLEFPVDLGLWSLIIFLGLLAILTKFAWKPIIDCLLYTSPSPRDATLSRMPSSA